MTQCRALYDALHRNRIDIEDIRKLPVSWFVNRGFGQHQRQALRQAAKSYVRTTVELEEAGYDSDAIQTPFPSSQRHSETPAISASLAALVNATDELPLPIKRDVTQKFQSYELQSEVDFN